MRSNHPVRQLVLIGALASAIGIAIGLVIDWFPAQASTQAKKISTLYDVLIIVSVPVFVLVATVVLYSVWRFRMRPGEEDKDGPPIHGNTRLEIIWTAVPSILIVSLVAYALVVLHDIEKKPAGPELQVNVTGQQFAWSYEYPPSVTGGKPLQSNVLYLPRGESVRFNMRALDVLHAFWVPAFRIQQDVVPGITTHYRVTPTKTGTFDVVCNELCGLGHSVMRSSVHVVEPGQFKTWLASQQQGAAGPAAAAGATPAAGGATPAAGGATPAAGAGASASPALVASGKQTFAGSAGCAGCHTLADAGASGQIGPNLDKVLKGAKHDAAFIRTSIVQPNAYIESGYPANVMPPNFGSTLSKAQVDGLVAYLQQVTKQ